MKTTEIKLTAAERRTLGNILANGGSDDLTQGANRVGSIRKSVVKALELRGLVTGELTDLGLGYLRTVYYATAAGCLAFGNEIARLS